MLNHELINKVEELRAYPQETEWLEFKRNKSLKNKAIGEYISALSNSAMLHNQDFAYIIWGIDDISHDIVGSSFRIKSTKEGNQELEFWLMQNLNPKIDFSYHEIDYNDKTISLLKIPATKSQPVKFKGIAYIRIGSNKTELKNYPDKERKIWQSNDNFDWSAQICYEADITNLCKEAVKKAREKFKTINQNKPFYSDIDNWNTSTFLNKIQITKNGKITYAALILLGNAESASLLSPSIIQITWKLNADEKAYEHFYPPFFLSVNDILTKIRNIKFKILPDNTLTPIELNKYNSWIILEALNNCIAHQDYTKCSRIIIEETIDKLTFQNAGSFYEGTVEDYVLMEKIPSHYRNYFLANAMKNLGMIDTIGYGINKMFKLQRNRYFPLPDFDFSNPETVRLKIYGKLIDENYSKVLIEKQDLNFETIILLDKVQKNKKLSKEETKLLRSQKLIEGRYPNIYIAKHIADVTGKKEKYIKNKSFDDKYYKDLIIDYLKKFKTANRVNINELLLDKLSDTLTDKQKHNKIKNILQSLSKDENLITNTGSRKVPKWKLNF